MHGGGGRFVDGGGSLVLFSIGGGLGNAGEEGRCGLRVGRVRSTWNYHALFLLGEEVIGCDCFQVLLGAADVGVGVDAV